MLLEKVFLVMDPTKMYFSLTTKKYIWLVGKYY